VFKKDDQILHGKKKEQKQLLGKEKKIKRKIEERVIKDMFFGIYIFIIYLFEKNNKKKQRKTEKNEEDFFLKKKCEENKGEKINAKREGILNPAPMCMCVVQEIYAYLEYIG
jgi:hypothetical protein